MFSRVLARLREKARTMTETRDKETLMARATETSHGLTAKEHAIARYLAAGMTHTEVGRIVGLPSSCVSRHVRKPEFRVYFDRLIEALDADFIARHNVERLRSIMAVRGLR